MKQSKLLRRLFAFLLVAAMIMPAVPTAYAAGEVKCEKEGCDGLCDENVLMEATCNSVGVIEYTCVKCKHSFLVKTDVDLNNHDADYTDNGDGQTHTATCPYHKSYKNVKEDHSFDKGYCTKCGAVDYSEAVIVLANEEIELSIDLDSENAVISIGKVSVKAGTADITKDYDITYNWYDGNNKVVSTDEVYEIPAKVASKLGNYGYLCFVMATPKNSIAGKRLSATCTITLHVLDMVSASAIVGSRDEEFTLDEVNSATTVSVFEQIYQAVYEISEGYPSYVVFDKAPESSIGELEVEKSRYYFVNSDGQKNLSEVVFKPEEDGTGNYIIGYTVYDNKGKSFPGVLTITVERELGEFDVAYFAQKGEEVALNATDFELFWQEVHPGGELKQILFLDLPVSTEGIFYYNYVAGSKNNKVVTDNDIFYVVLSNARQYLIDGVSFVPAGKFTGQVTVSFNASGLSSKGYYVQESGEMSIFLNNGEVEDVQYSMTSGSKVTLDADDFLAVYRENTKNKTNEFSIKLLDVPQHGSLYIDYTGTKRDVALTEDVISDFTFYYSSALSREIGDLTYVSEKSNKTVTDTLRYVVCDNKGEFIYMGEIVVTCKSAVVVYTKSFTDVKKGDWFYTYVMDLAEAGVIDGFPETVGGKTVYSYRPQNPTPDAAHPENDKPYQVTYGQALKLIMLAAGYAEQPAAVGEHWASGYLTRALKDGLVKDVITVERLDDQITRRMVAKIAAQAMKLPASTRTESPLKDVPLTDVYAPYILALYDAGIVNGSKNEAGDFVFKGTEKITRAEMATIVWRIYNYEA